MVATKKKTKHKKHFAINIKKNKTKPLRSNGIWLSYLFCVQSSQSFVIVIASESCGLSIILYSKLRNQFEMQLNNLWESRRHKNRKCDNMLNGNLPLWISTENDQKFQFCCCFIGDLGEAQVKVENEVGEFDFIFVWMCGALSPITATQCQLARGIYANERNDNNNNIFTNSLGARARAYTPQMTQDRTKINPNAREMGQTKRTKKRLLAKKMLRQHIYNVKYLSSSNTSVSLSPRLSLPLVYLRLRWVWKSCFFFVFVFFSDCRTHSMHACSANCI